TACARPLRRRKPGPKHVAYNQLVQMRHTIYATSCRIRPCAWLYLAVIIPHQEEKASAVRSNQQSEEQPSMSNELEFLSRYVAKGKLSRRDFLGRAAALGVSATFANNLLASAARAEGPIKGGHLKAGLQGGESSNVLDPALNLSQVNFNFGKCWGELL